MNGREVIKAALEGTRRTLEWFVSDFEDADLLVRPVPGANHAAWQIGNVIVGDHMLSSQIPGVEMPELPADFTERHGDAGAKLDGPEGFLTKEQYLAHFGTAREAVIASLAGLTDEDLDRPTTGQIAEYAPTVGRLYLLISDHTLMHAGQFTVIRRKLGKPVLF